MTRLICGSSVLALYKRMEVLRVNRICMLCDSNEIEDLAHFILRCTRFDEIRQSLLSVIPQSLSEGGQEMWGQLSINMILYVLLGLEYPFQSQDLVLIRYTSCVHIHRMYKARKKLEPL